MSKGQTLTQTLRSLGYSHRKEAGCREWEHVIREAGAQVFSGTAGEVWRWLRKSGQVW